ncbi:hypothetical protein DRO54_05035 [Candidatus Bathyarchaeota archaeon]|nr:MAG: hypothetical protein DRO54_05035 [Candidatus Bathyarchaeota archaeon]
MRGRGMYRRHFVIVALFLLVIGAYFPLVHADRGMIPVVPDVSVYEPGQKAIIAWNGQTEIMILSTDVFASNETTVLEVLPLPSSPEVEAASFDSFEEIQRLIWREGISQFAYKSYEEARGGSIEIVFHEQIGSHNLTVVKASDVQELVEWMSGLLAGQEIALSDYEEAINHYMERGFRYYVLDLITITPEERSVNPILYKFTSYFLYYPLVISSPIGGESRITLFLLTEDRVDINGDHSPFQTVYYKIYKQGWTTQNPIQFVLSKGDLAKVDLRIAELFSDYAWLTVFEYEGNLSQLTRDLMISENDLNAEENSVGNFIVQIDLQTNLILHTLLGAACTLAGVFSTYLIMRKKQKNNQD